MSSTVVPFNRKRRKEPDEAELKRRRDFDLEEVFADLGIKSFKTEYRRLSKMVGDGDFSSSKTSYAATRAMFAMMVNFLPKLEENCHKFPNERSAYALAAAVASIRELAHDLQSHGDQGALVERVRHDAVQPMLSSLATAIVSRFLKARHKIHGQLPQKSAHRVDAALKAFQLELTDIFADAEEVVSDKLAAVMKS